MHVQPPEPPFRFCLRLDVYPPPQVPQTNWRVCHSPLLPFVRVVTNSWAASLHGHYSASPLLPALPPPSRLPPISRCRRLYGFLLHPFPNGTRRASPVARCILVVVLWLPPRQSAASLRSVCAAPCCLRPSPEGSAPGARHFEATLPSLALRPDDSLTILSMALSMDSQGSVSFPLAIQATGRLTLALVGFDSPTEYTCLSLARFRALAFLDIRVTCQPFSRCAAPLARRDLPQRLRTTRHQWSAAADPAVPGPGMRSWLPTAPSKTCADQADRVFSGFLNVPGFLISSWPSRTRVRACGSTHERHLSSRHRVLEFQSAPRTQKRHSDSRDALLPVSRLARP